MVHIEKCVCACETLCTLVLKGHPPLIKIYTIYSNRWTMPHMVKSYKDPSAGYSPQMVEFIGKWLSMAEFQNHAKRLYRGAKRLEC